MVLLELLISLEILPDSREDLVKALEVPKEGVEVIKRCPQLGLLVHHLLLTLLDVGFYKLDGHFEGSYEV